MPDLVRFANQNITKATDHGGGHAFQPNMGQKREEFVGKADSPEGEQFQHEHIGSEGCDGGQEGVSSGGLQPFKGLRWIADVKSLEFPV